MVMCKKLIFLVSPFLLMMLTGNAAAQIDPAAVDTGHIYLFDDVSGTDVPDDSANNNTGTIVGEPQVVPGLKGNALYFDGVDDGVSLPDSQYINVTAGPFPNRTVIAVFKCDDVTKSEKQTVFEEGGTTRGLSIYVHEDLVYGAGWNRSEYNWDGAWLSAPIISNQWYAVALVIRDAGEAVEDDKFEMWIDGVLIGKAPAGQLHNHGDDAGIGYTNQNNVFHDGNASPATGHYLQGAIDEVWILNDALTETELGAFRGKVWPYAWGPTPEDGALYEDTWVNLAWSPGGFAVSHDVYMGESFDDVNAGAESTFQGNQAGMALIAGFPGYPYPNGLIPGTTYYWRVDEVNEADPNSPWKGDVWSFTIPPRTAYDPAPVDGAKYIATDATLSWTPGFSARLHYVYFGNNFDDVNNAAVGLPLADPTYTPATLELDKTYYWRIDEFDGTATNKGNVWSFTTMPDIPVTDDNLVCFWKLDEGLGTNVVDWSGHNNHGTLNGNPQWVDGYDGGALELFGAGDYVESTAYQGIPGTNPRTCCAWIKSTTANRNIMSWGQNVAGQKWRMRIDSTGGLRAEVNGGYHYGVTNIADGIWHHVAVTFEDDGTPDALDLVLYVDGQIDATSDALDEPIDTAEGPVRIGESPWHNAPFVGLIDDARIYDKVLTQEEIRLVMRIDPLLAWGPSPKNGSTPEIGNTTPLTWSPGDNASQHDIYFGTDRDDVVKADESDTTGIYRGRQGSASFTPAEGVEWGGGPYYWRIDEYNNDGTLSTGRIWTFTVSDFILVDDFESYDAGENQIWYAWKDGLGYGVQGNDPFYPGNGSGSAVGDENSPSYTEETIVHGGGKSMPFSYDNNKQGFFNYSEAELTLTHPRDWTESDVGILSLWFRGNPGGFLEDPAGTYTMSAAGTDIWGTADEFRYAYKQLSGAGSIVAQVLSVENTNAWAKAGVMIRESLDPGSKFAAVYITPANGCRFQGRLTTGASATSDTSVVTTEQTAITAPYWVRLDRDAAGNFNGYYSSDGVTWQTMSWNPQTISMPPTVYIGLALTSHSSGVTCTAEFSDVSTTGTVSPLVWTQEVIGVDMASNDPEPMYVALNSSAVVFNDNPNAALTGDWTEWNIDLQAFADQGVNLANVNTLAIGFGDKNNPQPGGSGIAYFDDIRLLRPLPEPEPEPEPAP